MNNLKPIPYGTTMLRYPHGFNPGGWWANEYAPTITTSDYTANNFIVEWSDGCADSSGQCDAIRTSRKQRLFGLRNSTDNDGEPRMAGRVLHIGRTNIDNPDMNEDAQVNQLFNLIPDQDGKFANPHRGRVYGVDGIAPCMHTCGGGNLEPKILEEMKQIPYPTTLDGTAYTVTTRYGAMAEQNVNGEGHFPMTAVLCISEESDNNDVLTCALRGRGEGWKHELEIGEDVANSLTTVQKDSMVAIISETGSMPMVMADPRKNYGRIQPSNEASPTLLSTDYKSPHLVMENENTDQPCRHDRIEYKEMPNGNIRAFDAASDDKRGVSEMQITDPNNPAQTLTCAHVQKLVEKPAMRIRKLTPRECFRLMDVDDPYIDKIQSAGISKSAQYKLAGNSIVVAPMFYIFKSLFTNDIPDNQQLSLF